MNLKTTERAKLVLNAKASEAIAVKIALIRTTGLCPLESATAPQI